MKNFILLFATLQLLSNPLSADIDDEVECPSNEEVFAGAVKEITRGECKGEWGLETFIGDFYPVDLPPEFQFQYARVRGCFHRTEDKGCRAGEATYRAVSIDSIQWD